MAGSLHGETVSNADPAASPSDVASGLPQGYGPFSRWLDRRLPVISGFRREYVVYPTPRNLNYLWNFGALATVALAALILTGIFLAINYTPTAAGAFASVETIDRQVSSGWVIRSTHMAGVSMFFVALYGHTFRSLYYGSYKAPREVLWLTGMLLLVLAMVTAFAGYVLPWGQMSYWGASVVSGAISSFPGIGHPLAVWLQGGDAIGDAALHRYYALHCVLGCLILGAVVLHGVALHVTGSGNPLGIEVKGPQDTLPFHPYYTSKNAIGVCLFLIAFAVLVFYLPGWLTQPGNYIEANPYSTPSDITPEWYFAPFYAVLRAVPSQFGGLLLSAGSVLVLFAVPWLDTSPVHSARFRPLLRPAMGLLVLAFGVLLVCGLHRPAGIWLALSRIATLYWFLHFLVLLPLLGSIETPLPLPDSIGRPVLPPRPTPRPAAGPAIPRGAVSQPLEKT
ncbi:cytochrome b [Lichenicoccus sp.]|uniref:cytochrome b n=1 Tax=Lichenicoccus sp. TaxID=2781899 RepID=UPI003D1324F7